MITTFTSTTVHTFQPGDKITFSKPLKNYRGRIVEVQNYDTILLEKCVRLSKGFRLYIRRKKAIERRERKH